MSWVGRVYSSLLGFYNEINSATLTGAIDVVIVKQEDGTYHSSPFHVRFGKLGVLRAREKIVDIEINGQPVQLHMKLGEAGEAFFVQEVPEDEEEIEFPAYLATSPILSSEELMMEGVARLKAESAEQDTKDKQQQEQDHHQQLLPQEDSQQQARKPEGNLMTLDLSSITKDIKSDSSIEEDRRKGKPRRKVLKKRKQKHGSTTRSSPRSQSMPEGLALEHEHIFDMEVTESTSEDEEVCSYSLGTSRSISMEMKTEIQGPPRLERSGIIVSDLPLSLERARLKSMENFLTPLSEPEMSPLQSPIPTRPPSPKSDTELDRQHAEEKQQQMLQNSSATWEWGEFPKQALNACDLTDSTMTKDNIDSVLERQDSEKVSSGGLLSLWTGAKQKKESGLSPKKDRGLEEKGIYLDDLAQVEDPEIAKLYLGSPSASPRFQSIRERERDEDTESGRGASLPQSPHSVDGAIGGAVSFLESEVRHLGPVSLSLCGGLADPDAMSLDKFMKKVITFDDLVDQPGLLNNPDLVVKVREGYYNWATAAPMVVCEMAFNKQLPEEAVSSLVKKCMPKKKKGGTWWLWRSSTNQNAAGSSASEEISIPASNAATAAIAIPALRVGEADKVSDSSLSPALSPTTSPPSSKQGSPRKAKRERNPSEQQQGTETDTDHSEKEASHLPLLPHTPPPSPVALSQGPNFTFAQSAEEATLRVQTSEELSVTCTSEPLTIQVAAASPGTQAVLTGPTVVAGEKVLSSTPVPSKPISMLRRASTDLDFSMKKEKYIKTLRLNSEQVAKLNLREGQNQITYSVTTQYQGTTRCICHIYLWNYDDKIVISDIDGTITKSDVMGQILPLIGRDWSQSGVAQLFTRLSNNGYKLLYLSARAIGQSRITKDLLRSIKQGELVLPDGPLLLNPTSLISAFHREVIVRNPEEFKISCLKDIGQLFPTMPFYAGFGNKINDVIAYRALNIPNFRIFTINPQGQLRHDLSHTFLSSYSKMSDVADHFFPPIDASNRSMSNEFSSVNYWRQSPPVVDALDIASLCTVDETSGRPAPLSRKSSVAKTEEESAAASSVVNTGAAKKS